MRAPSRFSRGFAALRRVSLLPLAIASVATPAGAAPALDYEVKAAFLLNFTKFVEWPATAFASPDSAMAICVVGKDPFGNALDETIRGEAVNGRKVTVQRLSDAPSPHACQVVYFGMSDKDAARILNAVGPGVLTVGEGDAFVRGGGMIGFVLDSRRVRFDINQTAAESAGLKLSSRLLSVARSVERSAGPSS